MDWGMLFGELTGAKVKRRRMFLLCAIGLFVNFAGGQIATASGIPFYFDSIGTVLAAAVGGYLPGILVGLATNFITAASNPASLYYGSLNVLIAVITAYFARSNKLRSKSWILLYVLCLTMAGGFLGGLLTWALFGIESNELSAGLVSLLYRRGIGSRFAAELFGSILLDFGDKLITTGILLLVLHYLPERIRKRYRFDGWQQRPVSDEDIAAARKGHCRKASLRVKLLVTLVVAALAIACAATGISFAIYREETINNHMQFAEGIAKVAAGLVPADSVDAFLNEGERALGYEAVKSRLMSVKSSSPDIEFVYVYRIDRNGCHVVFDLDTEEVKGEAPGSLLPFEESFEQYVPALLKGEPVEPVVSNDTYGWLLTVYEPVYNSDGRCACYVGIDMSMPDLVAEEFEFFARLVSLFLGFFVLVVAAGLWMAEYGIILPVNTMAIAAREFAYDSEEERTKSIGRIRDLDIHTGDEIENLYHTLVKTSADSLRYVDRLSLQNETIEKMQNGLILVLAEMVESRDANTGQHVRKTAAYVDIIMRQMKEEGSYADRLTETFMRDVRNSAPLHDVGKITIPDAILNKPGRLTDEEYAVMKTHTTAGRDIISKVIALVPTPGYLEEARNLAAHHHERWDGKGYPDGLAGEDIPLSARIMAVADVFDALVSKRSYKPGFPFEKALAIINEGVGTQFDPIVAKAFLHLKEEVRRIAESFGELGEE